MLVDYRNKTSVAFVQNYLSQAKTGILEFVVVVRLNHKKFPRSPFYFRVLCSVIDIVCFFVFSEDVCGNI